MVATPAKLQAQLMLAPLTTFPPESLASAVNCCVPFTGTELDIGEIVMLATLEATVRVAALLVTPPAVAVIWVVPAVRPVATPLELTEATLELLLVHEMMTASELLFESTAEA